MNTTRSRKTNRGGRPATTRSKSTPQIAYRVSAEQRAELEAEGKRLGVGANAVAKLRAFPGSLGAILALVAALAFGAAACDDGSDPTVGSDGPSVRGETGGAVGSAGGGGGAGGAGGADYTPDPAPTCVDSGLPFTSYACDAGQENPVAVGIPVVPTYNDNGTECFHCVDLPVPDTGCAIRIPQAVSGGVILHGPHDIFCAPNTCDPAFCRPKS
jgi:hypothetical protein